MERFGTVKYDKGNMYGYGNVRLGPHYYQFLLEDMSSNKRVLDIGCGDGIIGEIVNKDVCYKGVDIGAGCYDEVENDNVEYIRDYESLLSYVEESNPDISILMNVLEHTFDFSDLFERALKHTKETVFVSLPNEENIHLRLSFLLGKGINSHGLEMYGKHVNHRHLWLIQIPRAESILTSIAKSYGYEMVSKHYYLAFPSTKWKRLFYKMGMMLLPWNVKARNFALVFKRM